MPVTEPFIDAHSHVWTPDTAHYPLTKAFTVADMQPKSFTAEELLAQCRPSGVGRVNLIQMSYYEFDNRYMLDMIKLYPERFVGTAIVDPLGPNPGQEMIDLAPKGVRAFRIQPGFSKQPAATWLTPTGYQAMFLTAMKTGQSLSCLIDAAGFPEIDRMCRKFPNTNVIIDHLGRIGTSGTIHDEEVQALCDLAQHPRVYVKVGAFYALGAKKAPYNDLAPLIRRVLQAFGSRRLMWESDCPFQVVSGHRYDDSIALVRDKLDFLSKDDRDWLLRKTAQRLLFEPLV